jgi:hypothetical protein
MDDDKAQLLAEIRFVDAQVHGVEQTVKEAARRITSILVTGPLSGPHASSASAPLLPAGLLSERAAVAEIHAMHPRH